MIRGHIDFASHTRVEGWLHSDSLALGGARLLAYVDDDCVGCGNIDVFRKDLLAAGIGDGLAGFGFAIYVPPTHDPRVLNIRLEGGNVMLRQSVARLVARDESQGPPQRSLDPESLSWMLGRGWLAQAQYDVLRQLAGFGVCAQRLPAPPLGGKKPDIDQAIAPLVGEMLQLLMQIDVATEWREDVWGEHLADLREYMHIAYPTIAPIVALWSPWINCLNVAEGSHMTRYTGPAVIGIDYEFGGPCLLWLNLDATFRVPTGGLASALTVFLPMKPRESLR